MKRFFMTARRTAAALLLAAAFCVQTLALPQYLIPVGRTVGIKLYTKGLVVTELDDGMAAQAAGIRRGDSIMAANGQSVASAQELREAVKDGSHVVLTVRREGKTAEFLLTPERIDERWLLGMHVRDNICGIGTVTYVDPDSGSFGALGHGVGNFCGGGLLQLEQGILVASDVTDVQKGKCGTPGALHGAFDASDVRGMVEKNSEHGIFGKISRVPENAAVPVAQAGEIRMGEAKILANVDGTAVEEFSVRIEKLYPEAKNGRDLLVRVTDARLLACTGGIVQGMSGSPIIQDGKLVGAVTHVLVNDPTRGYGIFIEHMLDAAG